MSLFTDIEAKMAEAEVAFKAEFEKLFAPALADAKAELAKLSADAQAALAQAKAQAIQEVQANEPGIAANVEKYLSEIEAAVVAALGSHLVP